MQNADAAEIDDEKVFDVGAWLAVEMWMDCPGKELSQEWAAQLVARGLGERTASGTIALTRRGTRIEYLLFATRCGMR